MTEPEQSLDGLYNQARSAFDGRNWAATIDRLRQIILRNPKYPGAQELLREAQKRQTAQIEYEIGLGYFNGKDWPQAIERFEAALRDDPDHVDAQAKRKEARRQADIARFLSEADKHRQDLEWEQAANALKKALDLDPGSEEIKQQLDDAEIESLYQVGEQHFEGKRWRAASESLNELDKRRPGYKETPLRLREIEKQLHLEEQYREAQEYEQAGQWPKAIDLYDKLYRGDPEYRDVVHRLAYCREQSWLQKKAKSQEGREQAKKNQDERSRGNKGQSKKNDETLSSKWWWGGAWFGVGFVPVALIVFFRARYLHCLLIHRTIDAVITLVALLIPIVAVGLAAILADMREDVRKALLCILSGAAFPLVLFALWIMWIVGSPSPSKEECFPTSTMIPTSIAYTIMVTPSRTPMAIADKPTQTPTNTLSPAYTDTPVSPASHTPTTSPTPAPAPTQTPSASPTPKPPLTWNPQTPVPTAPLGYAPSVACVVTPCAPAPQLKEPQKENVVLTVNSTVWFKWEWIYCLPPGWKFAIRLSAEDPPHSWQYIDDPTYVSCQGGRSIVQYPIKIDPGTVDRFTTIPGTYYWNIAVARSVGEGWERLSANSESRMFVVKPPEGDGGCAVPPCD